MIKLLQNREDVFDDFTEDSFIKIASENFEILENTSIKDSKRKIYLMKNRNK